MVIPYLDTCMYDVIFGTQLNSLWIMLICDLFDACWDLNG